MKKIITPFTTTARRLAVVLVSALVLAQPAMASDEPTQPSQPSQPVQPSHDAASFISHYSNTAQDLILKGLELVGVVYRWGGTNPEAGLDCSGFVQVVFRDAAGLMLPRTSREMSAVGVRVADRNQLKPGDLVFFNTLRRSFSHVGIYLGENRFLHSPRTGSEVKVEDMSNSYWTKHYEGGRRIVAH